MSRWGSVGLANLDLSPESKDRAVLLAIEFNRCIVRVFGSGDGEPDPDVIPMVDVGTVAIAALTILTTYTEQLPEAERVELAETVKQRILPGPPVSIDDVTKATLEVRRQLHLLPAPQRPAAVSKLIDMADGSLEERDDKDRRCVFGVGSLADDSSLVVCGVPAPGWRYMRGGRTLHWDLRRAGVPVSFVLFGASDYTEAKRLVEEITTRSTGSPIDDRSRENWAIPDAPKT